MKKVFELIYAWYLFSWQTDGLFTVDEIKGKKELLTFRDKLTILYLKYKLRKWLISNGFDLGFILDLRSYPGRVRSELRKAIGKNLQILDDPEIQGKYYCFRDEGIKFEFIKENGGNDFWFPKERSVASGLTRIDLASIDIPNTKSSTLASDLQQDADRHYRFNPYATKDKS